MSKIKIRGVIVPSMFDDDWLSDDIEKGLLTPLSVVENALEDVDKNEPLELYINSPGGSVFAGHEMLNAIRQWQQDTRQPVEVTVGAMSASAASTISTMLGPVKAHENAMFMFHGAQSIELGGSQAMSDTAKLLDKINSQVMTALVSRYGLDSDMVAEWFAEGRMGWLDATEARQFGLVSEIIPAYDPEIEYSDEQTSKYQQNGLAITALLEHKKDANMNILQTIAEKLGMKPEQVKEEDVVASLEDKLQDVNAKTDAAYDEGLQAGKAEGAKEAKAEAETDKKDLTEKLKAEQTAKAEVEAKKAELETEKSELETKLEQAEQRISQIDKGFGADTDTPDSGQAQQYWNAVQTLVDDGHSKSAAMLKVQREQPALHKAMLDKANKR